MKTYLLNGSLITSNQRVDGVNVVVENRKIIAVNRSKLEPEVDSIQIDATGKYICPGLIDIHFHGAMGKDAMDGSLESLQVCSDYCGQHGVTSFYPTTWAAAPEDIMLAINNVKENRDKLSGARALGMHIEGPYLNTEYRGAQLKSMVRNPQAVEYQRWFDSGVVKLITCAPEIDGGIEFIKQAVKNGVRISIGHSGATFDQVIDAANYGASQATHIFNGMVGLHHREPGTVGGLLEDDRIFVQIISDGVHLHHAVVKLVINAKSNSRVILITDSIRGAGLSDGDYNHKGQVFHVRDGIARTPEGGLSGSTLTMDAAIRNAMEFTGKPIEFVLPMATSVPANAMGISHQKGFIKEGYDADLVLLDEQFHVNKTIVNGKIVFAEK
jgi:N-acetylglucosamine-6-phosphate deacetylase